MTLPNEELICGFCTSIEWGRWVYKNNEGDCKDCLNTCLFPIPLTELYNEV